MREWSPHVRDRYSAKIPICLEKEPLIGCFITHRQNVGVMSPLPSIPTAHPIPDYLADGARIAAILFIWGVLAAFFVFGVGAIGRRGNVFGMIGQQIGAILLLTGLLNALLYLLYRAIDYWHQRS